MEKYYARICWNSEGWRFPSGDAPHLEQQSYAAKNGFGNEEWLFNFVWIYKGYHYAFLQPIHRSKRKMIGKAIDALLWAINPEKQRVQVGEVKNCQVLTDREAQEAFEYYNKMGWLQSMKKDIERVGGNLAEWPLIGYPNIRFRPEDAIQYDVPLPRVKSTDSVARLSRYSLVSVDPSAINVEWEVRLREGTTSIPMPVKHNRAGSLGSIVDPYHPVLQCELMKLLREEFGENNVVRESRYVDITVKSKKRTMLIEIKTYAVAKMAIREALGQILEYAYFWPDTRNATQPKDIELFIVAPAPETEDITGYLKLLRIKFNLPIRYCCFFPGNLLPRQLCRDDDRREPTTLLEPYCQ